MTTKKFNKHSKIGKNIDCDLIGYSTEFHFRIKNIKHLTIAHKKYIIKNIGFPFAGLSHGIYIDNHNNEISVVCVHFSATRIIITAVCDPRSKEAEQLRDKFMEVLEKISCEIENGP